jgi:hypothetical protein
VSFLDSYWMYTFGVVAYVHLYGVCCCNVDFSNENFLFPLKKNKKIKIEDYDSGLQCGMYAKGHGPNTSIFRA